MNISSDTRLLELYRIMQQTDSNNNRPTYSTDLLELSQDDSDIVSISAEGAAYSKMPPPQHMVESDGLFTKQTQDTEAVNNQSSYNAEILNAISAYSSNFAYI